MLVRSLPYSPRRLASISSSKVAVGGVALGGASGLNAFHSH